MWIRHIQGLARILAVTFKLATSTLEKEEKVMWALCPNCHRIGEEGGVCTNCKDMGMIYNIPMEDKGYNLQNHNNIDQELHGSSDETPSLEGKNKESQESGGMAHDWRNWMNG